MEVPAKPLPKTLRIGICTASLYHKEQRVPTCSNCLSKGHHANACEAPTKCKQCLADHHKAGDKVCPLTPKHAPSPIPDQSPPPPPPQAKPPPHPSAAHLSPDEKKQQSKPLSPSRASGIAAAYTLNTPTSGKRQQRERSVSTTEVYTHIILFISQWYQPSAHPPASKARKMHAPNLRQETPRTDKKRDTWNLKTAT